MTLVFDTSGLSALLSGDDHLIKVISEEVYDQMIIPLACDTEIRFGFMYGSKNEQNLNKYELFKRQFNVEVKPPDEDTAVIYADLASWCRQKGLSLSHNDLWIGACAVQSGGRLLTKDQDFAALPQVSLLEI